MTATLTLIEKTVCLKSAEVFAAIPTEPLAQIASRASEVHVDRGETLFREGDDEQGIFVIVTGIVELRKDTVVVRVLKSGSVHGELFLQENDAHQYTAVACDDTRVLNLSRADLFDALHEYPEFGVAMVKDFALRLHKLTEQIVELELQLGSGRAAPERPAEPEGIESPAPEPELPKRRGWWRLAARAKKPTPATPDGTS